MDLLIVFVFCLDGWLGRPGIGPRLRPLVRVGAGCGVSSVVLANAFIRHRCSTCGYGFRSPLSTSLVSDPPRLHRRWFCSSRRVHLEQASWMCFVCPGQPHFPTSAVARGNRFAVCCGGACLSCGCWGPCSRSWVQLDLHSFHKFSP